MDRAARGRARYDGVGFTIRQGRPESKRGKGKIVELYIKATSPVRKYLASCTFPGLLFVTDEAGKPRTPDPANGCALQEEG